MTMTTTQLRTIRTKLGLSQAQLAARLGVHLMTVWRWEAGKVPISPLAQNLLKTLK
jgi:DNA-binding transcriptional regulator YiaG